MYGFDPGAGLKLMIYGRDKGTGVENLIDVGGKGTGFGRMKDRNGLYAREKQLEYGRGLGKAAIEGAVGGLQYQHLRSIFVKVTTPPWGE